MRHVGVKVEVSFGLNVLALAFVAAHNVRAYQTEKEVGRLCLRIPLAFRTFFIHTKLN